MHTNQTPFSRVVHQTALHEGALLRRPALCRSAALELAVFPCISSSLHALHLKCQVPGPSPAVLLLQKSICNCAYVICMVCGTYLFIPRHWSSTGLQQLPNGIAQPAPAQRLGYSRGPSQQPLLHPAHHPRCLGGQRLGALRAALLLLLLQQLLGLHIFRCFARTAYSCAFSRFDQLCDRGWFSASIVCISSRGGCMSF